MKTFRFLKWALAALAICQSASAEIVNLRPHGDRVYVLERNPDRIRSYDMGTRTMGASTALPEEASTFWVDGDGLWIGYARRVEKRALDGSGPEHLANTTGSIRGLYSTADHLFVDYNISHDNSVVKSFAKSDFAYVSQRSFSNTDSLPLRVVVSPGEGVAAGWDIRPLRKGWRMDLAADGTIGVRQTLGEVLPYNEPACWVLSADDRNVLGPDGMLQDITTDTTSGSVHGEALDAVFPASGGVVVLRDNGLLVAYDDATLETGRYSLSDQAERLFLSGTTLFAFRETPLGDPPLAVEVVELSAVTPPAPPVAPDSFGFIMDADQVEFDAGTGTVYVLDADARVILRRNLNTGSWMDPMTLGRVPMDMALSSDANRLYLRMSQEEIHRIAMDLGETTDSPWRGFSTGMTGLLMNGAEPLAFTWDDVQVLNPDGSTRSSTVWSTNSSLEPGLLEAGGGKVFLRHFAHELYHWTLDGAGNFPAAGQPGELTEGIYDPGVPTRYLTVSGSENLVLLSNGKILNTSDLSVSATLPVAPEEGVWVGGQLFTLRTEGTTETRLEAWDAGYLNATSSRVLEGVPLRIFAWNGGLLVVTHQHEQPLFHQLGTDLVLTDSSLINRPPTEIGWTAPQVQDEAPAGSALGTFSSTDPTVGDTHTYETGLNPDGLLEVVGNELRLAKTVQYAKWPDFRNFSIISTDSYGLTREETFVLAVMPDNLHLITDAVSHGPRYDPGQVFHDSQGVAYVQEAMSTRAVLHRWSTVARAYLSPIPLAGKADLFAYEPGSHDLFVSYLNGGVTRIDLDDPAFTEQPFAKFERHLYSMDVIDGKLVISVFGNNFARYKTFSLDGRELASRYAGSLSWGGDDQIWDAARRRVYTYTRSDNPTMQKVLWFELNADGSFGDAPSGYDLDRAYTPPLRLEAVGDRRVLLGDGVFYHPDTLLPTGDSLGETITEAFWMGGQLYTLAVHPETYGGLRERTQSLLARWASAGDGSYTKTHEVTVEGEPLRIWDIQGELWVLTRVFDQPRMALFHPDTLEMQHEAVVNRPPGPPQLAPAVIDEFLPAGTLVGTVTSVDPFPGIELSYNILAAAGPFELVGNEVRTTRPLDSFTDPASYTIWLMAWDNYGWGSAGGAYRTIQVQYVPQPPSNLDLDLVNVFALDPAGTTVGTFTVEDREGDAVTHTLELVDNPDGLFNIHAQTLRLEKPAPDQPDTTVEVRVRVTNSLGESREETFSVPLLGLPRPVIETENTRPQQDERVRLTGNITAPHGLVDPRWTLNGVEQGALPVTSGSFDLDLMLNQPGLNNLEILVDDHHGNTAIVEWTGTWTPIRTLEFQGVAEVREGAAVEWALVLQHPEDIRGGLMEVAFEPERFESAEWTWSPAFADAFKDAGVNMETGRVTVSFALGAGTLSGPDSTLGTLRLRAGSIPEALDAPVWVESATFTDIDDADLAYGTYRPVKVLRILPRTLIGDSNGNDRLDTGDLQQLLAFLSGVSTPESWDITGNDLNENGILDSGDLTLLQSAVTEQERLEAAALGERITMEGATIHFDTDRYVAQEGDSFWVELQVDVEEPLAGVELRLDYPADVLRLAAAGDMEAGPVVPITGENAANVSWQGGALHDPQQGWLRFSAVSPTVWADTQGVVLRCRFTVLPGAGQKDWSIRVAEAETTNGAGELRASFPPSAVFSTLADSASSYADWSSREFPDLPQPVPPLESSAGDHVSNLMRYALGLGGTDSLPADLLRPVLVTDGEGRTAFGLAVRLVGGSLPVRYVLETKADLLEENWQSHPVDPRRLFRQTDGAGAEALYLFETETSSQTQRRFMRLRVELP